MQLFIASFYSHWTSVFTPVAGVRVTKLRIGRTEEGASVRDLHTQYKNTEIATVLLCGLVYSVSQLFNIRIDAMTDACIFLIACADFTAELFEDNVVFVGSLLTAA